MALRFRLVFLHLHKPCLGRTMHQHADCCQRAAQDADKSHLMQKINKMHMLYTGCDCCLPSSACMPVVKSCCSLTQGCRTRQFNLPGLVLQPCLHDTPAKGHKIASHQDQANSSNRDRPQVVGLVFETRRAWVLPACWSFKSLICSRQGEHHSAGHAA